MFVLYLIRGYLIPNTLLWSLYESWFQVPNIHILFFLISLDLIDLILFLIGMTPMISYINLLKALPCVGLIIKFPIMSFWGAPLYIQFLLNDIVSYEKEMNVDVLAGLAT